MNMQIINSIGLCLDIFGVPLVAYYGFPMTFLEKKIVQWGLDPPDRKKQKCCSWTGTILIFSGFIIQLIANWFR